MSEVFVISDLHFNHVGILTYCQNTRPYDNVVEMNEALIETWNANVTRHDHVYVLGDFAFSERNSNMTNEHIFNALNGSKTLIVGNHDEKNKSILKLGWNDVKHIYTLRWSDGGEKIRFELCHYPFQTWKNVQYGAMHAHGHCHGNLKSQLPWRFDVGVDAMGVNGPINIIDLYRLGLTQDFVAQDHHGD